MNDGLGITENEGQRVAANGWPSPIGNFFSYEFNWLKSLKLKGT